MPLLACRALNVRGEPCASRSVNESGFCAYHAGTSRLAMAENAHAAARRSAEARRLRAERRKLTALDHAARIVEEHGQEIADCFLRAIRAGDWKAAEAVMNRIYGRPDDALVVKAPAIAPAAQEVIRSLSLEEKVELLARLRQGADLPTLLARRGEGRESEQIVPEPSRGARELVGRELPPAP